MRYLCMDLEAARHKLFAQFDVIVFVSGAVEKNFRKHCGGTCRMEGLTAGNFTLNNGAGVFPLRNEIILMNVR